MRVAIIGSGVSGIAAARVLARFGHEVVVYERLDRIGGVWAISYPDVRLQNIAEDYRISDFPWPFPVDRHPTSDQILRYLKAAVEAFDIDVRLSHDVMAMQELSDGWSLQVASAVGEETVTFDYVVVAIGHYSGDKPALDVPGREKFSGTILTEREVRDLDVFSNKRVAVVGFGKTAVDMATFAAKRDAEVHHVFRAARWMIPRTLFGIPTAAMATRSAAMLVPTWVHMGKAEAALHRRWPWIIAFYWKYSELLFRTNNGMHPWHVSGAVRKRLRAVEPDGPLRRHLRAAVAQAPDAYYRLVARGKIQPHRTGVAGFDETALLLTDGSRVEADVVVAAIGQNQLSFSFLPECYRTMMTMEEGGTQLYRHLIHPRIPRMAFAGFNHASLHIPAVEISMIWLGALLDGDLELPPLEEMEARMGRVADWKAANTLFEPTRAHGIGGRFHQYVEVLLAELGVRPARKASWVAEQVSPYVAADYADVYDEYRAGRAARSGPLRPLPYDT